MASTHSPSQLCQICTQFNITTLLKLPTVSPKPSHRGVPYAERTKAMLANLPILIPLARLQSSCPMCRLIGKHLDSSATELDRLALVYKSENFIGGIETLWFYLPSQDEAVLKMTIYADNGVTDTWAAEYIPLRPFQDAGSASSVRDIQNWLTECNTNHGRCRYSISGRKISGASPLPTRIIYVGQSGLTVRLVAPTTNRREHYVSLSHCWGGQSVCQTVQANLEQHKHSITISHLTKTVQDAIQVVRNLGLRYLWVDSLCIIQDDKEDWLREAGRMAAVYEGSYFTIAASASKDGSGGCLVSQATRSRLRVPCEIDDASKGYMYFGVKEDKDPTKRLFDGALNKRAWVMQEHLFARRTIHFAEDQLYWECDKYLMGQERNTGDRALVEMRVPMRAFLLCILGDFLGPELMPHLVKDPPQGKFDLADYHSWWLNMIEFFSTCGLTKASDKLPALLSLSTELAKLTGDEYIDGHWLGQESQYRFLSSLLWCAKDKQPLEKLTQFRAPSWSWAALDGPLGFVDKLWYYVPSIFHPEATELSLLKVQNFEPAGMPVRKSLLLSGVMIPATRKMDGLEAPPLFSEQCMACERFNDMECIRINGENGEEVVGGFTFDTSDYQPDKFWLLPIYTRWVERKRLAPIFYVLIIAEVSGQKVSGTVFERVGVGHIEDARMASGRKKQFLVLT